MTTVSALNNEGKLKNYLTQKNFDDYMVGWALDFTYCPATKRPMQLSTVCKLKRCMKNLLKDELF